MYVCMWGQHLDLVTQLPKLILSILVANTESPSVWPIHCNKERQQLLTGFLEEGKSRAVFVVRLRELSCSGYLAADPCVSLPVSLDTFLLPTVSVFQLIFHSIFDC